MSDLLCPLGSLARSPSAKSAMAVQLFSSTESMKNAVTAIANYCLMWVDKVTPKHKITLFKSGRQQGFQHKLHN